MSVPFIIWALRRTGGTSFSNLMIEMSGRPRLVGEPFNWERELGWISIEFERTRNEALLRERVREVLAEGPIFKHAYEVVSDRLNPILMQAATDAGYRHILLTRSDEVGRVLSLHTALATGHWGEAETRPIYDEIVAGTRAVAPFDIPAMIEQLHNDRQLTAQIDRLFTATGVDPLRVDFGALYADPEAGRAKILEIADALSMDLSDLDTFNQKSSIALTSKGQRTAEVFNAIPNFAQARRALQTETALLPMLTSRFAMQHCQIAADEAFLIEVDAPFLPHREIYFDDAAGRPVLALMCVASPAPEGGSQDRGGDEGGARLVFSRHEADGTWGPAITLDLPGGRLAGPITLALRWGEFQLRANGRTLIAFDPARCFGVDSVPSAIRSLRTNFDLRRLTIRTGDELALQVAYARRLAAMPDPVALDEGVTLIVLARGLDLPRRQAEVAQLQGAFARVEVLNPFTGGPGAVDGAIADALDRVGTRQVMIASGRWSVAALAEAAALARSGPDTVVSLGSQPVWRAGMPFAVLGPTRFAGRPVFSALGGLVVADPACLALADWRRPAGSRVALGAVRKTLARLPFALRRDGATMLQLPRPVRASLILDAARAPLPATLADLLAALAEQCAAHAADEVLILAADADDPTAADDASGLAGLRPGDLDDRRLARIAALGRQPLSDVLVTPSGMRLSVEVVSALAPPAGGLDDRHGDAAAVITALAALARQRGFAVADGPDRVAIPAPAAEVEPIWALPDPVLNELCQNGAAPAAIATVVAIRDWCASPANFAGLVVQAVAAQVPGLTDAVSNLELDRPGGRWIARMLTILRPTGLLADPEVMRDTVAALTRRRYSDEVRALVRLDTRRPTAQTRLALMTADIAASAHLPADRRFAGTDPGRLLPPDLPAGTSMGDFGEALSHYLSVRRDWPGILALVDLIGSDALTNYSYEHWIMALIGLGRIEGTEALIADGHARWRLHDWSQRRLSMHLAHRAGDPARVGAAVASMLASDPEMAPLIARPTAFDLLNGAPGVAAGEVACVIVARNEFVRLKWLVDYYRRLGVTQTVIIDNHSTDETVPYFLAQRDVKILQTAENYRDSRYGVKWHNEVCACYFDDRWVLTVDADEVLVFDGSDAEGSLRALTARMDAAGAQAFATAMIDMYAEGPLDQTDYKPGQSLIEAFPLFDGSGYWFDRTASFPDTTVSGGVRIRRFWNDRHDPRLPYISMQKTPLVRWHPGFRYLSSTHEMTPAHMSVETGALLHFKFLPDFHARAIEEVARGQHYDGAREYRIYAEILKDPANRSFRYDGSVRYEGPQSLIAAGLMTARQSGG